MVTEGLLFTTEEERYIRAVVVLDRVSELLEAHELAPAQITLGHGEMRGTQEGGQQERAVQDAT